MTTDLLPWHLWSENPLTGVAVCEGLHRPAARALQSACQTNSQLGTSLYPAPPQPSRVQCPKKLPVVIFWCCCPSALRFEVFYIHKWYSTHLDCNKLLFEPLLALYFLIPVCSLCYCTNKTFPIPKPLLTDGVFPSTSKRWQCMNIQQFIKFSDQSAWHQQWCKVQSFLDLLCSLFSWLIWTLALHLHFA